MTEEFFGIIYDQTHDEGKEYLSNVRLIRNAYVCSSMIMAEEGTVVRKGGDGREGRDGVLKRMRRVRRKAWRYRDKGEWAEGWAWREGRREKEERRNWKEV